METIPVNVVVGYAYYVNLAWSPDSSTLAIAWQEQEQGNRVGEFVELVTLASQTTVVLHSAHHSGASNWAPQMALSPDGSTLAFATQLGGKPTIYLWSVTTGALLYNLPTSANYGVFAMAFSPDSKTLAVGGAIHHGGVVEFWTVATGQLANSLSTSATGGVVSVAFSADGKSFADAGSAVNYQTDVTTGVLELWSLSNLAKPVTLKTAAGSISVVTFAPDSATLCDSGQAVRTGSTSYSGSNVIETWSVPSGARGKSLPYSANQLAYSPDGTKLYAAAQSYLISMPASLASSPKALLSRDNNIITFALSPDGATIITPASSGTIEICPTANGKVTPVINSNVTPVSYNATSIPTPGLAFSPAGTRLAVCGGTRTSNLPGATPAGLMLFNPANGVSLAPPGSQLGFFTGTATALNYSPDGKTLAYVPANNGPSYIPGVNLLSGGAVQTLPSALNTVNVVAYSPDGAVLVDAGSTHGGGGIAEVRSLNGSSSSTALVQTNLDTLTCLAISPDSQTLALGGMGLYTGVELWNLKSLTRIAVITSLYSISGVAISPDSGTVAFVGFYHDSNGIQHGRVEWWSTTGSHQQIGSTETGTTEANCLCYSNGGGYLFVGTELGVQIYSNANFGRTGKYGFFTGSGVSSIAMAPGGADYAFTTFDGSVVMAQNPNAASDIRASVVVSPGQIKGGSTGNAIITLSAPAPAGGIKCSLSSSSPAAQPASAAVTIPAGKTSASVHIVTRKVTAQTEATIQVSVPAGAQTTGLIITQ
jgi:WD40 repeat protein